MGTLFVRINTVSPVDIGPVTSLLNISTALHIIIESTLHISCNWLEEMQNFFIVN